MAQPRYMHVYFVVYDYNEISSYLVRLMRVMRFSYQRYTVQVVLLLQDKASVEMVTRY